MNIWKRKALGKRLGIFGLALLLVYTAYKGGFGTMLKRNKEGKTRVSDLPTSHAQCTASFPSQNSACFFGGGLIASICAVLNWDISTRFLSLVEHCITTVIRHFMCVVSSYVFHYLGETYVESECKR